MFLHFRSLLTYSNLDYALYALMFFIAVCLIAAAWTLFLIWRDRKRTKAEENVSFFELMLRRRGLD